MDTLVVPGRAAGMPLRLDTGAAGNRAIFAALEFVETGTFTDGGAGFTAMQRGG